MLKQHSILDIEQISGCSNENLYIALSKIKFVRHENENIKATKSQKMSAAKKEMQKYLNAPT